MHRDSASAVVSGRNTTVSQTGGNDGYRFNTNSGTRQRDVVAAAAHSHGVGFYDNSYTSGSHQTHTHSFDTSYNGSSINTESRPDNLTIKIWKRVS